MRLAGIAEIRKARQVVQIDIFVKREHGREGRERRDMILRWIRRVLASFE